MKRQRFSLGELTIILVVVGLLLAVIMLTGPRSWGHGRNTSSYRPCFSQLKQLGSAAAFYAIDNLGSMPGPFPSPVFPTWDVALGVQMGITDPALTWGSGGGSPETEKILGKFICDADDEAYTLAGRHLSAKIEPSSGKKVILPVLPAWGFTETYELRHPLHRSFSLNLGDKEIAQTASDIPVSAVKNASGTIMLCDLHDRDNLLTSSTLAALTKDEFLSQIFDAKKTRYHGASATAPMVGALFHDGHVELLDERPARLDGGKVFKYSK